MRLGHRIPGCHVVGLVVLLATAVLLVACGGSKIAASAGAGTSPLDFAEVDARVQDYMACAIPAGRAQHLREDAYVAAAIRDAGIDALRRNALDVAGGLVPRFEKTYAPNGDQSGRGQAYLEAIVGAAGMTSVPDSLRAKARAYEAYYQSLAVGSDCTLDPAVLRLINKS